MILYVDLYSFAHSLQTVLKIHVAVICYGLLWFCLHSSLNHETFRSLFEETCFRYTSFCCVNEKTCTFPGRIFNKQHGLLRETKHVRTVARAPPVLQGVFAIASCCSKYRKTVTSAQITMCARFVVQYQRWTTDRPIQCRIWTHRRMDVCYRGS